LGDGIIEVFDSLVPKTEQILHIRKYRKTIEANNRALMPITSDKCGEFCIYFAINRILNPQENLSDIIEEYFASDLKINEKRISQFINHIQENLNKN